MKLRHEELFVKTGVRFVLELLPQDIDTLKELVHISLHMESKGGDKVDFEFGNQKESKVYSWLLMVQNMINNSSLDLLLESEKLTMPESR